MGNVKFAVVRSPRKTWHAVEATGSRADGSLYQFGTLCGLDVGAEPEWQEGENTPVTCGTCKRLMDRALRGEAQP
jgi:hypothetical protein